MRSPLLLSPWLEHLGRQRPLTRLTSDLKADVAVVGAGIAGVTTTYYLLTRTRRRVAILEANRVAHGATGHNAGQLASYFERPFVDMVEEFGLTLAAQGQKAVDSSWDLLEEIRRDLKLAVPCLTFQGFAGCKDLAEVLIHLRNNQKKKAAGLPTETVYLADTFAGRKKIPAALKKLYLTVPHQEILDRLATNDREYIAALEGKKGCLNSAAFTEEVVNKLLERYPGRLLVAEHTPVKTVRLFTKHAELETGKHVVRAKRVVLCTNGFEKIHIENFTGSNIDVKFHHLIRGSVGYMAAFTETPSTAPTAISYLSAHNGPGSAAYEADPYYYLTRRPHGDNKSLVCVGGPEALLSDTNTYSSKHPYPGEAKELIDTFVKKTYRHAGRRLTYTHLWHGLMGYTPNGIRCVGAEPCNPVLLYNVGCNGIGILPSIYGGYRISQIIKGEYLTPSIFDPADQRCIIPEEHHARPHQISPLWFGRRFLWGILSAYALMSALVFSLLLKLS